jgi:hypothetical protein
MLKPIDQIRRTLTSRNERKELLVLACEVDRASWRQACHPVRSPRAQLAHDLLGYVDSFRSFLPGRLGRWARGATFLASLGRQLGWLRF